MTASTESARWLYTAEVMQAFLQEVLQKGRVASNRLPKAVHNQACAYFGVALGNDTDEELPSAANAYGIVAEGLNRATVNRVELEKELKELAAFTKTLNRSKTLSKAQRQKAESLQRFFSRLQYESEAARF